MSATAKTCLAGHSPHRSGFRRRRNLLILLSWRSRIPTTVFRTRNQLGNDCPFQDPPRQIVPDADNSPLSPFVSSPMRGIAGGLRMN